MTLIVHHLQVSQSERIVWLCEELGIEYTLKLHQRDPLYSPQSIKDLNRLGQAPVIQDGDITLAESPACCDYINYKYGGGRLALPPSHANYSDYLYWFHFANGNLQSMLGRMMALKWTDVPSDKPYAARLFQQMDNVLTYIDERVRDNTYLAGSEFTAADCMTVFTLTTMRTYYPLDLSKYTNILAYLKRVVEREGYKKARAKGDPGLALMIDGKPPAQYIDQLKAEGKI